MRGCPKDLSRLFVYESCDFDVWKCKKCAGLWFPPKVVSEVIGHPPTPPSQKDPTEQSIVQCPEDRVLLIPIHSHGVEIDLCPKCGGVWLDHGELETILTNKGYSLGGDVAGHLAAEAFGVVLEFIVNALS